MFKIEWKKCHLDHADILPDNKTSKGQWTRINSQKQQCHVCHNVMYEIGSNSED